MLLKVEGCSVIY